jgi:hypothetical protein
MKTAFITGCGHTGTTLLARIIGNHSQVYLPLRETNIFLAYNALIHNSLLEAEILTAINDNPNALYYIEKTPRHIWHVDYIRRATSDSKFILCTRNGYDVIASIFKRTMDIKESIRRYKDDSLLTIRQLDQSDVILVKYENIILCRGEEIKKICKFLGLKYEKEMLNYHKKEVSWNNVNEMKKGNGLEGDEHNSLRNWQANQPIFQNFKTWNEIIPEHHWEEVSIFFESYGNEIMLELGY